MGHIPHLFIQPPWEGWWLIPDQTQVRHLERVLRLRPGDPVTYTDGHGLRGEGSYREGMVERGEEVEVARPSRVTVVAAVPAERDRVRFLVEKLSELGVATLRFLRSIYGQGKPQRADRLHSWAVSGLEQSRGAWLLDTSPHPVTFPELDPPYLVCDTSGETKVPPLSTVVVGPEGGWAPGEVPSGARLLSLGPTVLRVETAALVAATRLLSWLESDPSGR